ncbi:MAG TPA: glycosyltransferase family 39 protein, partial [Anaerolineae bacterium]
MRRTLLPLLVLWLAFGLRLYRLDFQSIWWDEGHSIFVASHPIAQIPTLPAMDVHPPAYFALLHGWMALVGRSEFALRYLSVSFSLLTVALLWRFGRALSPSRSSIPLLRSSTRSTASTNPNETLLRSQGLPLLVSLLAALSPLYVAYAQEVRSYAMITFLALASTFGQWYVLFAPAGQGRSGKRHQLLAAYIVFTAAALYTHYFTVFLLLFQNLVWLGWVWLATSKRQRPESGPGPGQSLVARFSLWISSQIGILILFAPQLLLALRQVTSYTNLNLVPPSLTYFLSRSWQTYTMGLTLDPVPAHWGMGVIAGVLILGWLTQFWIRHAKPT